MCSRTVESCMMIRDQSKNVPAVLDLSASREGQRTPVGNPELLSRAAMLTASFAGRAEAAEAFRRLNKRGFRRIGLLHKTPNGEIHARDRFVLRRVLRALLAAAVSWGGGFRRLAPPGVADTA